jgi:hypothetical protein
VQTSNKKTDGVEPSRARSQRFRRETACLVSTENQAGCQFGALLCVAEMSGQSRPDFP